MRPLHSSRALGAWLLLSLAACSGAASQDVRAPWMDAPEVPLVSAVPDPASFDRILVSWRPVAGDPLGYEVEGSLDGVTFAKVHDGLVPPEVVQVEVEVATEIPELTSLWFRVRAVGGGLASDWGGPVEVARTLRPPDGLYAWLGATATTLYWTTHSVAQNGWLLERRIDDPTGAAIEDWTALPVPFPADQYVDPLPGARSDGALVRYRLSARAGEVLSREATAIVPAAPLLAPAGLAFTPLEGAVGLSWTNVSAFATEVAVYRAPASGYPESQAALLPATATAFEDVGLLPGRYSYRVVARRPQAIGGPLVGESAIGAATALPIAWGPLVPTWVALPPDVTAVVQGSAWYAATGLDSSASGGASVFTPAPDGFVRHGLGEGSRLQAPGVLLDPLGRPHVVFAEGPRAWTTPVSIVHEWLEDGAWKREVIASRILSAGDACQVVRAAIDPSGTLHAVWMAGPSPASGLEYATNPGGTWTVESISAALPVERRVRYAQFQVAAEDSELHLLLNDWGTLYLAVRAAGVWTVEQVPVGAVSASYSEGDLAFARTAGTTLVGYLTYDGGYRLNATLRTGAADAGAWSAPQLLGPVGYYGLEVAASPDGRMAIANDTDAPTVWVYDAGEWSTWRGFDQGWGVEVGFSPDGKLWLLDLQNTAAWDAPFASYLLYVEP